MENIVKICKKHGELSKEQTVLNRFSPNGKEYLRCRICRNEQARNRLKDKYVTTPKKHEKHKLPKNMPKEDRSYAYTIRHRFKISAEQYQLMLVNQNYVCAICKNPETQLKKKYNKIKMLSIDHCHVTNKIRGLLCHQCNVGLGAFKDNIETLNSAINYLIKSSS